MIVLSGAALVLPDRILTPGTLTWTGTVTGVPANFPPRDEPYFVRVYDPHLVETASGGIAASRLLVGGQAITGSAAW